HHRPENGHRRQEDRGMRRVHLRILPGPLAQHPRGLRVRRGRPTDTDLRHRLFGHPGPRARRRGAPRRGDVLPDHPPGGARLRHPDKDRRRPALLRAPRRRYRQRSACRPQAAPRGGQQDHKRNARGRDAHRALQKVVRHRPDQEAGRL
ncbi:hypothetical protein AVDCRST_MAG82-933, partial [uncultured Rubrobacteraceae bacterium]